MRRLIAYSGLAILIALTTARIVLGQSSAGVVKAQGYSSVDGVRPGDKFKVAVAIEIADGYHINAHVPSEDFLIATTVEFEPAAGLRFGEVKYPPPEHRRFEFSPDKELAVHEGIVYITADVEADKSIRQVATLIRAKVTAQACNDQVCLAPADQSVEVPIRVVAANQSVQEINADLFKRAEEIGYADPAGLVQFQGRTQAKDMLSELIESRGILIALVTVFWFGLALNLTPCVYPIIPITIGFFVNQSKSEGSARISRTFLMASMYVLGMAITYSILGVIAATTGGLFGAALQSPVVLIGLAALMVALSLSMFGVYEFRLPDFMNRFATESTQATSGLVGALVMGLTMGIVAAPCIGPFVVALLVHVGAKGDPVYGFFLFFILALGLGLPYLVLGTFSGALKSMPRSGLWMVTVRKVFGLILIGLALYFLMPLMGRFTNIVFVVFFAVSALYLIFWEAARTKPKQFGWVLRAIGVGAAAIAVLMALPKKPEASIAWQPYSEQVLSAARSEGRGVIIDAFADWCIPCKELDRFTFTDPDVRKEAERFVTLKLDLTSDDSQSEAARAKQRFNIFGLPTIIFIDGSGREVTDLRLTGYESPEAFLVRMKKVESPPDTAESEKIVATNIRAEGTALTDAASGAAEPAPAASLDLLSGGKLELTSLRGKVVLIDFWATWCLPCISEIPMFNQLNKSYKGQGLELIAISLDEEGAEVVKPFLKKYPMNYTQTVGDRSVAEKFRVEDSSLPVAVILDKQGRVRFRHVGITKQDVFEAEIKQLLAE